MQFCVQVKIDTFWDSLSLKNHFSIWCGLSLILTWDFHKWCGNKTVMTFV